MVDTAAQIWRDYVTEGVPASGAKKPEKAAIREYLLRVETGLSAAGSGAGWKDTKALLDADLAHDADTIYWVGADTTPANNGIYVKSGASGSGSWVRKMDLPMQLINMTVTGGTANAITATAPVAFPTVPFAALFTLQPTATNTGAVTVTVNGGSAVAVTDYNGDALTTDYFTANKRILLLWNGTDFQAATDMSAEYWAAQAAASAADAESFSPAFLLPETSVRGGAKSLLGRGVYLGDDAQIVLGQEFLAAWYKALVDKKTAVMAGSATNLYGFLLGDSKVAGTGTTSVGTLDAMLDFAAGTRGFTAVDFGRYGYGGEDSVDMDTTRLATLMANPNFATTSLVILNFGTNERVGVDRTIAETEAAVRSICAKLWDTGAGGRSVDDLSILIMGQTTANNTDSSYNQDDDLMRELNTLYREIAIDVGACFVDCYSLLRQPHAIAGWMDVSVGGSHVHPGNNFNAALTSYLSDVIFPQNLEALAGFGRDNYPNSGVRYPATATLTAASAPSAFGHGQAFFRTSTSGSAWPLDGVLTVVRNASGVTTQTLCSRTSSAVMLRTSLDSTTWNDWVTVSGEQVIVAPQGGWTIWAAGYDLKARIIGGHVHLSGLLQAGTTTSGTVVGILPVGMRPAVIRYADCRQAATLGNRHPISIATSGNITLDAAFAGTYLSFDGVYFSL